MLSITAYYKHLKAPIERVQTLSGGSAVHSFSAMRTTVWAGVEIEFRKEIVKDLRFGVNGSYMYTNVKLPEGGAYTNSLRALQEHRPTRQMQTSPIHPLSATIANSALPCSTICKVPASTP